MKRFIDYFIESSLVVNLITFVVLIAGIISVFLIQKETFPDVNFDQIMITASYPGSSPEDVEKLVTIPIERKVRGVDGIEELNAMSTEGSLIMWVKVDPDYSLDDVLDDVRSAVDSADDIPPEVESPLIQEMEHRRDILLIPVKGDSESIVRTAAKDLRDYLESKPGISRVELSGYREVQIRIQVNPKQLSRYQLTVGEVVKAVQGRNLNLSAGKIERIDSELFLRTISEFENVEDVENVVIRSNPSGRNVQVKDIAKVEMKVPSDKDLERSDGKRAVFLKIKKRKSSDVIKVSKMVKEETKSFFNDRNYEGVDFNFTDDFSFFVKRRLGVLVNNGVFGLLLVFVSLTLFLNFRVSLLTSLGAPLAFMAAFALMDSFGMTLNLISMFGLILVLGMLVDDAIIVAENFYQHIESGKPSLEAAKIAAKETIAPVSVTIITTVLAFGPIFFMGGIMGKFLWPVPAIVILCLIASWLECFFILPNHLADFGKLNKSRKAKTWYLPLLNFYEKSLRLALKMPWLTVLIFVVMFFLSVFISKMMRFELFPGDDVRVVSINVKGNVGTPIDVTDQAMQKLEKLVEEKLSKKELEQTRTWVGRQRNEWGGRKGTHYGTLIVYLTLPDMREKSTDELVEIISKAAKEQIKDFTITVTKQAGGPPKGKDVDIALSSGNLDDLKLASKAILEKLKAIDGVTTAEIDFEMGKKQIIATVDDFEARRLGLTTKMVALELRRAISGERITKVRKSDEDIDVVVILDKEHRSSIKYLQELTVTNSAGRLIPIAKVLKFSEQPGSFVIRRKNGKRAFSIYASLDRSKVTPIKIQSLLKDDVMQITSKYQSMQHEFGGENKDTKESMVRLAKAGLISMLLIYLVLVIMFRSLAQPFIIMSVIPLGFTGVIMTFLISNWAIGFMALMGMVGLIGVVINDSIVLVNFINIYLQSHRDTNFNEAIAKAAISRFRPVLLTTITTVAGLLPIALATNGDPFLRPMALSFAGGLAFATAVTLIFVPALFSIYTKFINRKLSGGSRQQYATTSGTE